MASRSTAYISLEAMEPAALAIVKKHEVALQTALQDASQFWTDRNICTLESRYSILATELSEKGHQALAIKVACRKALMEIQTLAEQAQASGKKSSRLQLLSLKELEDHAKICERKINDFALNQLSRPEAIAMLECPASLTSLLNFDSASTLAKGEKELYFGLFDLVHQSPLDKGDIEISSQPKPFQEAEPAEEEISHLQTQRYFLKILPNPEEPPIYNPHIVKEIHADFSKRISLHHQFQSTALNLYRLWIITLEDLLFKLKKNPRQTQAIQTQVQSELILVQKLAHEEYVNAYKKQEYLDQISELNIPFLLDFEFRKDHWPIYDSQSNCFKTSTQSTMSKQQALETLSQIDRVIEHLSLHYNPLLKDVKDQSIGSVIKSLLAIMEKIERTFVGTSFFKKSLEITDRTKENLEKLCKRHLESVLNFCQAEGQRTKKTVLIEQQLRASSASLFYLKLAADLNILNRAIPQGLITIYCRALTMNQEGTPLESSMRERIAETTAEKRATKAASRITDCELFIHRSEGHERLAQSYIAEKKKEQNALIGYLLETSLNALNELQHLDLTNPSKVIVKDYTDYFFKKYPETLFCLEIITMLTDFEQILASLETNETSLGTIVFDEKKIAFIKEMANEYRSSIRPHILGRRSLVEISSLISANAACSSAAQQGAREKSLSQTQNTLTEMLIMGLRFYHGSMHTLSSLLDWPETALQAMFTDHLLMLKLKGTPPYKDSKKMPSRLEMLDYKRKMKPADLRKLEVKALELTSEFRALLIPYRTLQTDVYNFFSELSNIILGDPHYLIMNELKVSDIELIRAHSRELIAGDSAIISPAEKAAITALTPHLDALQAHLESGQEANHFFLNPIQGEILSLKGVNPVTIKLAVQALKLLQNRHKITHLNIRAFNELFSSGHRSTWQAYANATINFTTQDNTQRLQAFCEKHQFSGILPIHTAHYLNDYEMPLLSEAATIQDPAQKAKTTRDIKRRANDLRDVASSLSPIVMLQDGPNQYFLKWPLFIGSLEKSIPGNAFEQARVGIVDLSKRYNEAKRTIEVAQSAHN